MKKLLEKIKSYFEKITVVIPDGRNEDGTLKYYYDKISIRKIKKTIKRNRKALIWIKLNT